MKLAIDLFAGYYHPTRRAGHSVLASALNGIRLAHRCLREDLSKTDVINETGTEGT